MTELPEITPEILAQWETAAQDDLAEGQPWSVHPAAILSVVRLVREQQDEIDRLQTEVGSMPYCSRTYYQRENARADAAEQVIGRLRKAVSAALALADKWDPPVTPQRLGEGFVWDEDSTYMADTLRDVIAAGMKP